MELVRVPLDRMIRVKQEKPW